MEVVQLLLSAGAGMEQSKNPLFTCSQQGHTALVQLLLSSGAVVDFAMPCGATSLYIACQEGHAEIVQLLVKNGASVDRAVDGGETPLFAACDMGNKVIARALLSAGAIVDQPTVCGTTPLFMACQGVRLGVARVLLNAGAEVNKARNDGATPLVMAVQGNNVSVVRLLLKHRADPTIGHPISQETALHLAVFLGHRECCKLLSPHMPGDKCLCDLSSMVSREIREKLDLRQCACCEKVQVLGYKKFSKCGKCLKRSYCSRDCQLRHWKDVHRHECEEAA
jgi:ankyrin repeat protein